MYTENRNAEYEPIGEPCHQYIKNPAQDDAVFKIFGFKYHHRSYVLFNIIATFLLGIPHVICMWYPSLRKMTHKRCALKYADVVFLYDTYDNCSMIKVKFDSTEIPSLGTMNIRYFCHQYSKYVWNAEKGVFAILDDFIPKCTLEEIVDGSHGLLEIEEQRLLNLYGPNKIEVEIKSYWKLFVEEIFNPFYIFQIFSVILWFFDDYMIYAGCVLVLTITSAVAALKQTRSQSVNLHNMVETSNTGKVQIIRRQLINSTDPITIDPQYLVPGTLLIIPRTGCTMPCDAVLLTGNCIVNESMLTGESVPVLKTPPNSTDEIYSQNYHKGHTLFSGTEVIQGRYLSREHILARVVTTGFDTTKGSLVKSIMFPVPVDFKFYKDSLKFVFFLFIIAAAGMVYCLYLYILREAEIREMIIRTLDLITIVVPPALPAAMTVGIVYSQNRLKKLGIFCISTSRINISGKLKLACFDKTGTLTHEGLDLYSVLPTADNQFGEALSDVKLLDDKSLLVQAMATCHSLTRIDGKLNGDPLDLIMFDSTQWNLEEPGQEETNYDNLAPTIVKPNQKYVSTSQLQAGEGDFEMPYEIGIIRQFQFSSSLQRMSVICRVLGSRNMILFTKGAPEKIQSMCTNSSIPKDFPNKLAQFTAQGFRVIAVAYKKLETKFKWKDAQKVKREHVECELTFLGFIVMQNSLKAETTPVISTLHAANIRTVMITGDNIMTAICVARECGMVKINDDVVLLQIRDEDGDVIPKIYIEYVGNTNDKNTVVSFKDDNYHFAIDGKTWANLRTFYPDLLPKLLVRTTIFARFQPDQKTQLIASFQSIDYVVSMVGDGANDCGALKAAHIGISLSQAEASVAAPFTSSIENISCLIHVMLEGRCALVTSFAVFKYMALYSLIQFFTIIILYKNNSMLGDQQFLFIDLIITTSLAITIGRQGPYHKLNPKRPMGSLIAGINLVPMVLQILLCAFIQYSALCYLKIQPWYEPNSTGKDEIIMCWDNTVLFTVSCFQYVILAIVYSKGSPYRELPITNFFLIISSLSLTCFITYLCIYPSKVIADFFELLYLPLDYMSPERAFRDQLLLFPIAHFCTAVVIEHLVAESLWTKRLVHFVTRKKGPKNKFKTLLRDNTFQNWFHQEDESCILYPP